MKWSAFFMAMVFLGSLLPFGGRAFGGYELQPVLTIGEVYTDNLYNDENDEISEFVTRLMPSLSLLYDAARLEADLAYTLDYRFYAKGERGNEAVHFFEGTALLNYAEWAYLEISESVARVSLDSTRDFREESLFQEQSDRSIFTISPYLQFRPSARSTLRGGYEYADTEYEDDEGVDRKASIYFLESSYELTEALLLRSGYSYIDEDSSEEDHEKQDLWAGLRLQAGQLTSFFATFGHTWIEFDEGPESDDFFWDVGVSRDFGLLVGTVAVGVTYLADPEEGILREENYRLSLSRDWSRSRLSASVSASDYYDVEVDELDTRRYGFSSTFNHELSPRWTGTLTVSANKYEEQMDDTWTRVVLGRLALGYEIAEDMTATGTYYRIDSHSPQEPDDRYETNQVMLEVRKVF